MELVISILRVVTGVSSSDGTEEGHPRGRKILCILMGMIPKTSRMWGKGEVHRKF